MIRKFVGLDLGQHQDYSALAAIDSELLDLHQEHRCRSLHRWPLRTKYVAICADVARYLNSPAFAGALLVLDETGVGNAVYELASLELSRHGTLAAGMVGVTITSGSSVSVVGAGRWHVPKRDLVSVLQIALQSGRLRVAQQLPEAAKLVQELETFRVKQRPGSGHESFEAWRERDHDDLVLALALAVWAAETLDWQTEEE